MLSNIKQKIANKHFLSLAGNGIMSVLGMITIALLYHALPLSEIGAWVFFQSTFLLVDTLRSGFLTTAFIKFYAGAGAQRSAAVAGSAWLIAISITAAFVLLSIPAWWLAGSLPDAGLLLFCKWFGAASLCTLPQFMATCVQQGEQRFDRLLYVRFISQGSFILLVGACIVFQQASLHTILYAYLLSSLLTSLVTLFTGWCRPATFASRQQATVWEIFHFGKYSVGTTLSANLFRSSDTFIINFMLGAPALAVYNIGQRLMEIVEIPLRSFAATGMPALSAAYNSGNNKQTIGEMKKYIGLLTISLVPALAGAVVFADVAVALIGGGKYAHTEAANVLRIFMTFALLYPADRFFALTLDVIHKPKVNFYKVLIMLAGNISADFAGICLFGNVYGVALATVVPILIGVVVGYYALQSYYRFSFISLITDGFYEMKWQIESRLTRKRNTSSLQLSES